MSTWFYYDNNGQKQGPVSGGQLKGLAKAGVITPETMIETEDGKTATAGQVKGLTFVEPVQVTPKPLSAPPSPAKQTPTVPSQSEDFWQPTNDFPQWDFSQEITQSQTSQSQPAQTLSPPTSRPTRSRRSGGYDYDRIAAAHRLTAVALWLYTIMLIVSRVVGKILNKMLSTLTDGMEISGVTEVTTEIVEKMPSELPSILLLLICGVAVGLIALGITCFSIFCVVRLSRAMNYGMFMTIVFAIGVLMPIVGFFSLLGVYLLAGKILKG